MEIMNGITLTEAGIGLVLVALLFLIMQVRKLNAALAGPEEGGAPAAPASAAPASAAPAAAGNDELIAVITAAVAAVLDAESAASGTPSGSKFVVRTIRRVHNAPAWNRAGREEQIYSRM